MRESDAVWTVPNVISMIRIALIGVFVWLMVTSQDAWAITVLALAGVSDFLDGFLARRMGVTTRLGRMLDPAADRLLTIAVVVALGVREIVPWWLIGMILARDAVVGVALLYGRRHHAPAPRVTFVGKTATFALYVFLPLSYLAYGRWDGVWLAAIVATCAAAVLYWIAGIGYVLDVARHVRDSSVSPGESRMDQGAEEGT